MKKIKDIISIYVSKLLKFIELKITCWHIEIKVGVSALESGVVPKNLTILRGLQSLNQSVNANEALLANNEVLPQPP